MGITLDSTPSSPVLCDWCQTTVFDKHLLAVIDRGKKGTTGLSTDEGPFETAIDPVAYFGNRDAFAGSQRSFRQNTDLLLRNASRGCIFCMLLNNARGGLLADFDFMITVDDAWKWSKVSVAGNGDEDTEPTGYFRVYKTVGPVNLAFSGLASANGDFQHGSSLAQQLARDGGALRALVDDCTAHHPDCKPREGLDLPSMLLYVSGTLMSPTVRLIKMSDIDVFPVRYVCLSYCWGKTQPNVTTTSRLNSYTAGIDTAEIPETILDAIRVAISMGFRYLWVDAFCIVQDSGPDKITELGKMASIYSGAACTICVMSAKSANEGFLRQAYLDGSENQSIRTWHADIYDGTSQAAAAVLEIRSDFSYEDIFDSPIFERGWTFQEALLSPRLVMFFPHGQRPALRCSTHTVQSDGGLIPAHPKALVNLREVEQVVERERGKWGDYDDQSANAEEWVTIVKQYSQRSLTYEVDKMPAFMGIVSEWETRFGQGAYWAGVWSATLTKDLIWKSRRDYSPRSAHESYVAPSWSWASRAHPVYYQDLREINTFEGNSSFEVVSCEVIPAHEDLPNGAIKSAQLTVKCIAELVDLGDSESEFASCAVSSGSVRIEFDDSPRSQDIREVWLLYVNDEEPYNNPHGIGIAVAEVDHTDADGPKLYKRVGCFVCAGRGLEGPRRTFTII
ncbi:HET domain-containing protein [Aspergillus candidus]|uniref:Heterokaryon incompatibility protein-domain-containing protein n=1 Tax=Aspergillus candidus TaxID=41067 RepID=A0A2I2F322_ASPCN|nr:heterokaryon incompatibility protein-domain-containing protein [Aspergillus candidus]PLB35024.1 heterokaryon incompatibility protein-domain-containing protein [Aspergillus candidus]